MILFIFTKANVIDFMLHCPIYIGVWIIFVLSNIKEIKNIKYDDVRNMKIENKMFLFIYIGLMMPILILLILSYLMSIIKYNIYQF
jgi:hypothetical protein